MSCLPCFAEARGEGECDDCTGEGREGGGRKGGEEGVMFMDCLPCIVAAGGKDEGDDCREGGRHTEGGRRG